MVKDFTGVNFISKGHRALPVGNGLWFNIGIMRKWLKPALFSVGIVAAGLIATNPSFVLPYKYHFAESQPMVSSSDELIAPVEIEEVTTLPDGVTTEQTETAPEAQPGNVDFTNEAQAAVTSKAKSPTAWVAGSLSIPSLKISAPLVYVSERTEKAFQLGLQQGVVQYPGTALPGQLGNMYVFGHSSDYRWAKGSYKTVFAKLPNIKVGSLIKVKDGAGKEYTYKVTSTAIALPTETKYLSQYNYQKKILTVQTSYPVGTALKRFLAIAELVEE